MENGKWKMENGIESGNWEVETANVVTFNRVNDDHQ